jgi:hypothetical protein
MVVIQTENGLACWLLLSSRSKSSLHTLEALVFALYLVEGWRVSWRMGAVGAGISDGAIAGGALPAR